MLGLARVRASEGFLMTDFVSQARQAREKLAAALALLQTPEAGDLIDSVAEPVAKAMGALHQIEATRGSVVTEKGPVALDAVRAALAALQSQPSSAVADRATEIIAGSLGLVHGLAQEVRRLSERPPENKTAEPAPPQHAPAPQPAAVRQPSAASAHAAARSAASALDRTQLASDPAPAAPSGALDATLPTPTKPASLAPNISLDSTQASVRAPGQSMSSQRPVSTSHRPQRNSKMAAAPAGGKPDGAVQVEANLGAHSPTNFYKGLSGNDVVDDGGLFVATYDIPPLGAKLWVSVNMPGGYEFQGVAEVRWVRETGAGDAPPGFGCAFKDITKEARQLIYRYVRNREPLFHDDL